MFLPEQDTTGVRLADKLLISILQMHSTRHFITDLTQLQLLMLFRSLVRSTKHFRALQEASALLITSLTLSLSKLISHVVSGRQVLQNCLPTVQTRVRRS